MKRLEEEVVGLNGEIDALKRQRGGADYEAVARYGNTIPHPQQVPYSLSQGEKET